MIEEFKTYLFFCEVCKCNTQHYFWFNEKTQLYYLSCMEHSLQKGEKVNESKKH